MRPYDSFTPRRIYATGVPSLNVAQLSEIDFDHSKPSSAVATYNVEQPLNSFPGKSNMTPLLGSVVHSQKLFRCILGAVHVRTKSRFVRGSQLAVASEKAPFAKTQTITLAPTLLNYVFEIAKIQVFGQITRSLRVYPVLDEDDRSVTVFNLCRYGTIEELLEGFSRREFSPFTVDTSGSTLLHVKVSDPDLGTLRWTDSI